MVRRTRKDVKPFGFLKHRTAKKTSKTEEFIVKFLCIISFEHKGLKRLRVT
jgi:hypothetical protein